MIFISYLCQTKSFLPKSVMFVINDYVFDGLFKYNVKIVKQERMKLFFSLQEDFQHINYDTLCKLINLNCILAFFIDYKQKCKTCVEEKFIRSSIY